MPGASTSAGLVERPATSESDVLVCVGLAEPLGPTGRAPQAVIAVARVRVQGRSHRHLCLIVTPSIARIVACDSEVMTPLDSDQV
jgi:hypothetical protein